MKKRAILGLFVVILTIFSTTVLAEELFSGKVYSGDSITIDGKVAFIIINDNLQQIWFQMEGQDLYVAKEDCSIISYMKVCYTAAILDTIEKKYQASITITSRKPEITITRSVSDASILVGEEFQFSVVLKNTGQMSATDVVYEEEFLGQFDITEVGNVVKEGQKIVYRGIIKGDSEVDFTFKVKPTGEISKKTIGMLKYSDSVEIVTEYSDSLQIDAESFLKTKQTVTPSVLYPGREFDFTFNLSNSLSESKSANIIDISSFSIKFPSSIEVKTKDLQMELVDGKYVFADELRYRDSEKFSFKLVAKETGVYDIYSEIDYVKESVSVSETFEKTTIEIEEKDLTITIVPDGISIEEQKKYDFKITVKNPNPVEEIVNVKVSFKTNLTESESQTLEKIEESTIKQVFNYDLVAPSVEKATSYPIYVDVSYDTGFGEILAESKKASITVIPKKELTISKSLSSTSVSGGDTLDVVVSVDNARQTDVNNVNVFENIPSQFIPSGVTQKVLNLNSETDTSIYSYTLKIPYVSEKVSYDLNTTVEYLDEGVTQVTTSTSSFTINPREYKVSFTKAISDSEIFIGEPVDVGYTLTNSDDVPVFDVEIMFPQDSMYDSTGVVYNLAKLSPGEIVKLNLEKLRFKKNISTKVPESQVYYVSENDVRFSEETGALTITPKYAKPQGVLMLLNKSEISDKKMSEIVVQNLGEDDFNGFVSDGGESLNIFVAGKKKGSVSNVLDYGAAVIEYEFLSDVYYAYSNTISTTTTTMLTTTTVVTTTTLEDVVDKVDENSDTENVEEVDEQPGDDVKVAKMVKKPAEPGFFKKLIDKFLDFFRN